MKHGDSGAEGTKYVLHWYCKACLVSLATTSSDYQVVVPAVGSIVVSLKICIISEKTVQYDRICAIFFRYDDGLEGRIAPRKRELAIVVIMRIRGHSERAQFHLPLMRFLQIEEEVG